MWTNSKCGSDFRDLLSKWEHYSELWEDHDEKAKKARDLLDNGPFIMYFQFKDKLYGAPEAVRLAFATLKHPNKDELIHKDLKFNASDLCGVLSGDPVMGTFGKDDVKDIDVISDKDQLFDMLMDKLSKYKSHMPPDDDDGIKKVEDSDKKKKK